MSSQDRLNFLPNLIKWCEQDTALFTPFFEWLIFSGLILHQFFNVQFFNPKSKILKKEHLSVGLIYNLKSKIA